MTEGLLPLFPLETVLVPGQRMALHIFEERYKEMIGECVEMGRSFGIVRAQGRGIARRGCAATVEQVLKRYDDGRMDIVALGEARFEIVELDTERSFARARVRWFTDEAGSEAPTGLRREAAAAWTELRRVKGDEEEEAPETAFEMALESEDLDFRQEVLEARSEAERMEKVLDQMRKEVRAERVKQEMRKVVRQNGHGKHLGGTGLG